MIDDDLQWQRREQGDWRRQHAHQQDDAELPPVRPRPSERFRVQREDREARRERIRVLIEDIRSPAPLAEAIRHAAEVFHFAAQVAVTTSLADPVDDFTVNARGTLNVLEAIRACQDPPPLVYTSTNKVYGALDDVGLVRERTRYTPVAGSRRGQGIDETGSHDFFSHYGCLKGVIDQN